MLESVATIVSAQPGGIDKIAENKIAKALKDLSVERLEIRPLDPGRAVDILFQGSSPTLKAAVRDKLVETGACDVFVQSNDDSRRKKLLMSDMDATIVQGETIDEMALRFGLQDKIIPITERAMRGEIDFAEALKMRIALMKGMPLERLEEVMQGVRYSPGAETLVRTMRRHGARCVLISGGFDMFTGPVAKTVGFHKDYANRLEIENGQLTGEVLPPVVDKNFKKKTLEEEIRTMGIGLQNVMAVGDGANDIPMLQTAGVGVGYFAKPLVQAATPWQVRCTDLTALLFMQGYRREEFVSL